MKQDDKDKIIEYVVEILNRYQPKDADDLQNILKRNMVNIPVPSRQTLGTYLKVYSQCLQEYRIDYLNKIPSAAKQQQQLIKKTTDYMKQRLKFKGRGNTQSEDRTHYISKIIQDELDKKLCPHLRAIAGYTIKLLSKHPELIEKPGKINEEWKKVKSIDDNNPFSSCSYIFEDSINAYRKCLIFFYQDKVNDHLHEIIEYLLHKHLYYKVAEGSPEFSKGQLIYHFKKVQKEMFPSIYKNILLKERQVPLNNEAQIKDYLQKVLVKLGGQNIELDYELNNIVNHTRNHRLSSADFIQICLLNSPMKILLSPSTIKQKFPQHVTNIECALICKLEDDGNLQKFSFLNKLPKITV